MSVDSIPVLLDTDIGSDIDDALALAYLLRQPRCQLLGITTVTGNVAERAAISEVVCHAFGQPNIPIHLGVSDTLTDGQGQPIVPHFGPISHLPHRTNRPKDTAVDFLRQTIRSRPHEIVLLSIGPLANLAVLFTLDPEIPHLLKGIVSMAGAFFGEHGNEWNCRCDPGSATAAIKRSLNQSFLGLDVTTKCTKSVAEMREAFAHKPCDILLAMAEKWFEGADRATFHDPLAAATIFHPEICQWRTGTVSSPAQGETVFRESVDGPHRVAYEVDPEAFFAEYFVRVH